MVVSRSPSMPARAALGHGERELARAALIEDDGRKIGVVLSVGVRHRPRLFSFTMASATSFSARRGGSPLRGHAEIHARHAGQVGERQRAELRRRAPRKSGPSSSAIADSAIPVVRSVPDSTTLCSLPRARLDGRQQLLGQHAAHLARNAGHHRHPAAPFVLEPDAGRGAVAVGQHARAFGNLGLRAIRLRETGCWEIARASAPPAPPRSLRRASSRARRSRAIAGLVRSSLVGPSPPVVITAPVRSSASRTARAISSGFVADGGSANDLDAARRERARDMGGVRVDREAQEQLVTDGDQLDLRASSQGEYAGSSAGCRARASRCARTTDAIIVTVPTMPLKFANARHAALAPALRRWRESRQKTRSTPSRPRPTGSPSSIWRNRWRR